MMLLKLFNNQDSMAFPTRIVIAQMHERITIPRALIVHRVTSKTQTAHGRDTLR
jgi:hypothetical protein